MSAFLFTAVPSHWDRTSADADWLDEMADRFSRGRKLGTFRWSTQRVRGYRPGDRAYLLLQGSGPRGIIGSGSITDGEVYVDKDWRGGSGEADYVDIAWDAFVPMNDALPTAELQTIAPDTWWQPMGSGTAIKPQDEAAVELAWAEHVGAVHSPTGAPADEDPIVERGYRDAVRKVRLHQRRFRALLLRTYEPECAYCGTDVLAVLEAAHLIPDAEGGEASVENGRLLCANHHRALDAGLITWTGKRFSVDQKVRVPPLPRTV